MGLKGSVLGAQRHRAVRETQVSELMPAVNLTLLIRTQMSQRGTERWPCLSPHPHHRAHMLSLKRPLMQGGPSPLRKLMCTEQIRGQSSSRESHLCAQGRPYESVKDEGGWERVMLQRCFHYGNLRRLHTCADILHVDSPVNL
ncbi:hypothetical protein SKAU_G00122300 [Synaphobranchus kaupii]|uniref:Uncharacterized protein n=1 Tax=Synaphobranchus kaupii TaxID=118154 RepID=A0A9Q1FP10_SYNKA|nr:hypothetical protein SKAU_G00122300 [Synaphobranchus kaupii]